MPDRIAIIAVSRPGAALARQLAASLDDAELHLERRIAADGPDDGVHLYDLPLRPVLQELFARRPALAVFLPVGAAVRLLAPVLGSKSRDPAVVCIDDRRTLCRQPAVRAPGRRRRPGPPGGGRHRRAGSYHFRRGRPVPHGN